MAKKGNRPAPAPAPEIDREAADRTVSELRKRLANAGKRDLAQQLRKSYGEDLPCYGIKPGEVHNIGMDVVRRLRSSGYPMTLAVAEDLFESGNLEEGLIGAQLVGAMARYVAGGDFDRFAKWADHLTNSQTAEALGTQCVSRAMAGKPSIALKLLEWAKSDNTWKRVAAVSSFSPLVRDGRFMTDALTVADPLMQDEQEHVQHAVGTMLMEMTRLQAPRVVEFLGPWKDKAPRSVVQMAATKLSGSDREAVLG